MLIIKAHQIEAFARPSMERYEKALIEYLRTAWPRECRLTGGDAALLHAVRRIVRAAQANGYETSRQLTLYANLVFSLGIGFDTDPQFHWASTALLNESIENPTVRIERLCEALIEYFGKVGSPDSERLAHALRRALEYDFTTAPDTTGDALIEDLCDVLGKLWPEKLAFQETSPTLAMIETAIEKAARHDITCPMGRCVFATASYFFGHGVDIDPLHPWMASVLTGAGDCAGNDSSESNGDRNGAGNGNGAGNDAGAGEARAQALRGALLNRLAQSLTRE